MKFASAFFAMSLTQQHFDAVSDYWRAVYDAPTFTGYALREQHHFTLNFIRDHVPSGRVLDVGCGTGVTVHALAEAGYMAVGMDFAYQMVAIAQDGNAPATFQQADALHLPYAEGSFDAVIALGLLSNLRDDRPALHEIQRVLKPGGWIIASIANLLALDVWTALPLSLPILLNTTPLRKPARQLANRVRQSLGRPTKPADGIRFGRSVILPVYARSWRRMGWQDVQVRALTVGPIQPFGMDLLSEDRKIALSRGAMRAEPLLRPVGSVVMVTGQG